MTEKRYFLKENGSYVKEGGDNSYTREAFILGHEKFEAFSRKWALRQKSRDKSERNKSKNK